MDILLQGTDVTGPVGPLLTSFLLGFITVILLFWYSSRKHSYWKKLGVPHVPPVPFFGSVLERMQKNMHEVELDLYNKFGRIYGSKSCNIRRMVHDIYPFHPLINNNWHYEGTRPLLSVAEPDMLRDIMVKDFSVFPGRRTRPETVDKISESMLPNMQGENWKRVRTIVTPTFTSGKIKRMLSIFKDCSQTLVKNFRGAAETGKPVEAKRIYGAFTMDIIASSAFSTKIDSHNEPNNTFVQAAKSAFSRNWRIISFSLFPGIMKFFKIGLFPPKGLKFFQDVTLQIIEERKRTGQTRNDFLQLLIDTAKEVAEEGKLGLTEKDSDVTENYGKDENDQLFKSVYKKPLSLHELVGQCVIFFLAGYETTAATLSFATYLLALNPDIQEKLIKELDDVLRENNGELTYEAVQGMKYLDNVISETLRIFPPAVRVERVAVKEYKLGVTGIVIPKDMVVTIPIYAMHRDPKNFPDPEKFDPDRFTPEERAKRNQYTYLPFGAGPKNCVGMRFALVEIKVCLAYVLSNFRIKKCSETKVPLEFFYNQGLLKPKDISVLLEIRKDTVKAL